VHGRACPAQQPVRVEVGVGGVGDGGADAHRCHDFQSFDHHRRGERLEQAAGQGGGPFRGAAVLDDDELVARQSRHQVLCTHLCLQPPGGGLQQLVTGSAAQAVVDHPEVVEVDGQRRRGRPAGGPVAGNGELLDESGAVEQAGQRVVPGQVHQLGLGVGPVGFGLLGAAAGGDQLMFVQPPFVGAEDDDPHLSGAGGEVGGAGGAEQGGMPAPVGRLDVDDDFGDRPDHDQRGDAVSGVQDPVADGHQLLQPGAEQVAAAVAGPGQEAVVDGGDGAVVAGEQVATRRLVKQPLEVHQPPAGRTGGRRLRRCRRCHPGWCRRCGGCRGGHAQDGLRR